MFENVTNALRDKHAFELAGNTIQHWMVVGQPKIDNGADGAWTCSVTLTDKTVITETKKPEPPKTEA